MSLFEAPQKSLAGIDADTAASLISAAADVALYLDGDGVIRDVSVGSDDPVLESYRKWVGRSWAETVTVESRPKVEALLRDAAARASHQWRHINHPSGRGGDDVPVLYSAIQVGKAGGVIALGRDLRSVATIQQRLVDAQQSMERDYLRLRHMETRYRHLFESVSEAVLIADAATHKITEANPAAAHLLGEATGRLLGRTVPDLFDAAGARAVLAALGGVRAAGRVEQLLARTAGSRAELGVSASLFRQEHGSSFLVRLRPARDLATTAAPNMQALLLKVVDSVPDAFVVTEPDGTILTANTAFVALTQLSADVHVEGESLDRWLGRPGVDLSVLLVNLRQHGSVRLYATTLRGEYGATVQVEISAASVPHDERPCLGFTIRDVGRRLADTPKRTRELPRSVAQLTELVGRVPLKDIVGETTDLIEQLCIQAALELTRDNRASASEMLGLSRQSLYVKMRRYGLGDLGGESEK